MLAAPFLLLRFQTWEKPGKLDAVALRAGLSLHTARLGTWGQASPWPEWVDRGQAGMQPVQNNHPTQHPAWDEVEGPKG